MRFICDQCDTKYSIADEKVRNKILKIRCKNCGHIIVVREQPAAKPSVQGPQASFVSPSQESANRATSTPTQTSPFASKPASAPKPREPEERTVVARLSMDSLKRIQDGVQEAPTWFMALDGSPQGPVVRSEVVEALRDGRLDPMSLVWHAGWDNWAPANTVEELQDAFKPQAAPSSLELDDDELNSELAALDHPSEPALPSASSELEQATMVASGLSSQELESVDTLASEVESNSSDGFELGGLEDRHDSQLDLELNLEDLDIGPVVSKPVNTAALQDTSVNAHAPEKDVLAGLTTAREETDILPPPQAGARGLEEPTAVLHQPDESTSINTPLPASPAPSFFGSPLLSTATSSPPEPLSFDVGLSAEPELTSTSVSAPTPSFQAPEPLFAESSPFDSDVVAESGSPFGGSPFDNPASSPFGGSPFDNSAASSPFEASGPFGASGGLQETESTERTAFTSSVELLSNFGASTPEPEAENVDIPAATAVPKVEPSIGEPVLGVTSPHMEAAEETGEFSGLGSQEHLAASDEEALFFAHADGSTVPVTIAHTSHGDEAVVEMELPPLPLQEQEVSIDDLDILEVKEELKHIKKKSSPLVAILVLLGLGGIVVAILMFGPPITMIKGIKKANPVLAKKDKIPPAYRYKQSAADKANAALLSGKKKDKPEVRKKPDVRKKVAVKKRRVIRRASPPRLRRRKRPVKIAMVKPAKPASNDAMALALAQMAKMDKGSIKKKKQKKVDLSGVKAPKGVSRALIRSMYREVNRHLRQVKYCYELHLKNATFSGQLMMDLEIKPSGRVGRVKALTRRFRRKKVTRCIQRSMRRWKFRAFNSGRSLHLQVPFDLKPVF